MNIFNKKVLLLSILTASTLSTFAQSTGNGSIIFSETFGTPIGRESSKYVPSWGYIYADTTGITNKTSWNVEDMENIIIKDAHYAVTPPNELSTQMQFLAQYANDNNITTENMWWFYWSGTTPKKNATQYFDHWSNISTAKILSQDNKEDGGVLAVNAGNRLAPVYTRSIRLKPNTNYKVEYYVLVVNSSTEIYTLIRDGINYASTITNLNTDNTILLKKTDQKWSASGNWELVTYTFKTPQNCDGQNYEFMLFNNSTQTTGNDYYIDNISITQTSENGELLINCPTVGYNISGTVNDITNGSKITDFSNYYVTLLDDKGDVYMCVPVDANGNYLFEDVMNMNYTVILSQTELSSTNEIPANYQFDPSSTTTISVNGNNVNNQNIYISSAYPLPIKMSELKGYSTNNEVSLQWEVFENDNIKEFEVLGSKNGINFNTITKIAFDDLGKYVVNNINGQQYQYFKINVITFDNINTYTNTVYLKNNQSSVNSITVFPTMVENNQMIIESNFNDSNIKAIFYNNLGQSVKSETLNNGKNNIQVSNLSTGLYIISIEKNGAKISNHKVIIK